jgi:hypothetical protein
MRRRISVVIGLAILAGGAASMPALLSSARPVPHPAGRLNFSVTVHPPGKNSPRGLISWGTQDGHRWQVVLSGHGKALSVDATGFSFTARSGIPLGGQPLDFEGTTGPTGPAMLIGPVRADVTRVEILLPAGKALTLLPVRYGGRRYVGLELPGRVPIVRAVAYHGGQEVAYSVPYDRTTLNAWWLPGQVGPARFTRLIGSGIVDGHPWRYVAQFGPWGYCYAESNGESACLNGGATGGATAKRGVAEITCAHASWETGLAAAAANVASVEIQLSDGSTEHYPAVAVPGGQLVAYAIPAHQHIVRVTALDAAGHVVASGAHLGC